jgi:hypothetical protein
MTKDMMIYSRRDREKFFDDTTVMTGQDTTRQNRIGQDCTGSTGQDISGQDRIRKEG